MTRMTEKERFTRWENRYANQLKCTEKEALRARMQSMRLDQEGSTKYPTYLR